MLYIETHCSNLSMKTLVAIFFYISSATSQDGRAPIVDLGYVQYQGLQNTTSGINSYFGIPYAKAPTGQLRWQPPVAIDSNATMSGSKIQNASSPGPACLQGFPAWYNFGTGGITEVSEDCLLLDVLVPIHPVSDHLAVTLEIHGGGYNVGAKTGGQGPGQSLVNQSDGTMIHVSIQYRLGAYGFLAGPDVLDNGAANAGLLDQRAAMDWIQRYISQFGGDPSKVTISGGSGGGGAVMNQMIAYGGESDPPFRAVIAEYPWWQQYHNISTQAAQYLLVLNASGCGDLNCLRSLSADDLADAVNSSYQEGYSKKLYGYGDFFYGPVVDGVFVRDLPSNEFKQGHFSKVPLLVDREGFEGYIFSNESQTTTAELLADLQVQFPFAKQSFFTRLLELYPRNSFNSTLFQRQQVFGDFIISCPTYYMATAVSDWGVPVYKMIFKAGTQLHASLAAYIQSNDTQPTGSNATIASFLRDYYVSFATTLDPNVMRSYNNESRPEWPIYQSRGSSNFSVLTITDTAFSTEQDEDASSQCDFLHSQSYVVRN